MSYKHFTKADRMELSILLKKGYSYREIGPVIRKSASAISREVKENSTKEIYDPLKAEAKARLKRRMSKYQGMKISDTTGLEIQVAVGLMAGWSPEEVAGRLRFLNGGIGVISAKSIYKFCYSVRGQYLCKYLPHKRYNSKKRKGSKTAKTIIPDRIFIDSRPKTVAQEKRFGDFEGDTLGRPKGEQETFIGAVERKSLYLIGCKVPKLKYSMDGFKKIFNPHHDIVKSLTLDNGVENVRYQELNIKTFFCHPYHSWEKPVIENTFGRLRRFIPKRASLADYTNEQISDIISRMNSTPRKKLGYRTPAEVFNELYAKSIKTSGVALQGKM